MEREEGEEEACLPCCSTLELCSISPGTTLDIRTESLAAYTPRNAVWPWSKYKVLRVRFLNPSFITEKKWTVGNGESMNTINILDWANTWSKKGGGEIPTFVEAKPREPAEIRVLFNNRGQCNSKVGTKAQSVKAELPTMNLDLQTNCDANYKRHLVIHEFGHALGLGHEHQRSTFWSDIRPYINLDRMKRYFRRCMSGLSDGDFECHWEQNYAVDTCSELGQCTEYDPNSIMHYWFRKNWLHHPYNNIDHVTQCQLDGTLTDKQANALLGVHKRDGTLAEEPSELDIKLMREVYGGRRGDVKEETDRDGPGRVRPDCSVSDGGMEMGSPLAYSSLGGGSSLGGRSSLGGESSHSDSGLSLQSLAGPGDPNDMTGCYDGEVENRHMSRIEYKDSAGNEKVLEIYDKAAHEWKKIGLSLGLEKGQLKSIKTNGDDDHDRVTEVLGQWMQDASNLPNAKKYPKTWKALVELLKNSNLSALSCKLKDALLAEESSLRDTL